VHCWLRGLYDDQMMTTLEIVACAAWIPC
jgi:hypothetical protein